MLFNVKMGFNVLVMILGLSSVLCKYVLDLKVA